MILQKEVLRVHPEWNEKCIWFHHIPKFWFYDKVNNKKQYECSLCGLHINGIHRLERILGRNTPIGILQP